MRRKHRVLVAVSVASMVDQFNMPNIRLLQDMGYEVHVICNFWEGNTCSRTRVRKLQKTLREWHVAWHQWDCPRSILPAACCKAYRQLWKLTGRYAFAWIHCQSPIGGALARMVAHKRKIPVAYTAHGFHFYRGAPWKNWLLYYPVEALLAHWTDVLITVNREDYLFAKRHLKAGRIYRIPGVGIDVEKFWNMPFRNTLIKNTNPDHMLQTTVLAEEKAQFCRKYGIPKDATILLSVGELNKGKNHRMAIEALAALDRKDVHYLICGQGELYKKLQQYADRLGVGGRVHLPGYQDDMAWIYRNADLFVFPSVREGMPVALMEAMAAGLPCVVSDIRGNRELVRGGLKQRLENPDGIRFSLHKPWQLRDGLARLLEDDWLRQECGTNGRLKIRGYSKEAVERRMQKIYQELSGDDCDTD